MTKKGMTKEGRMTGENSVKMAIKKVSLSFKETFF
jgi:hypothetical protein